MDDTFDHLVNGWNQFAVRGLQPGLMDISLPPALIGIIVMSICKQLYKSKAM